MFERKDTRPDRGREKRKGRGGPEGGGGREGRREGGKEERKVGCQGRRILSEIWS